MPQNKQTFMSRLITYAQDMTGTSGEGWMIRRLESESLAFRGVWVGIFEGSRC